mmetsp:Transcript_13813/g.18027  ORF Transcript_13813/g.18027 Transcript_13813/m.18027 type:complete len:477 (+) Transcript_13813:121-1551(+)|eukprot:CAMPEP_0198144338 /NCGR_PEP_ID=MMETSP1443-20131203/14719_1 /TAXON_ID=186043 /ORGANISM="Entomoneis sp., Strain CCMP2396" /LENGTH=476 /DNA_ID=CAMNT_0043807709 /DNA_START=45 /DNA_END=1475 /DNA_ORIENTATION=+
MIDALLFAAVAVLHIYIKRKQQQEENSVIPKQALQDGTSLNATELIALVTPDNDVLPKGGLRANMRLENLWHRATYVLMRHEPEHLEQHGNHPSDVFVLVQKRSIQKDYCPGRFDPTPGGVVGFEESYLENAMREMEEEMGINIQENNPQRNTLNRLFTFAYEDERVRVWGDFYECTYRGAMRELSLQEEEVEAIERMSLQELQERIDTHPEQFMPDACHAMKLYFQRQLDLTVNRRMLKGYSSSDLDAYDLRPDPTAIFFDCDDCLYFDDWKTANQLTVKINAWCVNHGLKPGQSYELYKEYGTAIRGLLAEGYLKDEPEAIDGFLKDVHDIPIASLLKRDDKLRQLLLRMDPSIPKYIFTASVKEHAQRCLQALGIEDLFVSIIDCKACQLETKHSQYSFEAAMKIAGVKNPEQCLFLDDSIKNIQAARSAGWRSILVGLQGRDDGKPVSSEHAELEIKRIHDIETVLPELMVP